MQLQTRTKSIMLSVCALKINANAEYLFLDKTLTQLTIDIFLNTILCGTVHGNTVEVHHVVLTPSFHHQAILQIYVVASTDDTNSAFDVCWTSYLKD